jgi:hypothetical protein
MFLYFDIAKYEKKLPLNFKDSFPENGIYPSDTILKPVTQTLLFSNYTWYIKSGIASPGPNNWNPQNAFVDSLGRLHLKITYNALHKMWECAEVWTTVSLGFGKYEWFIDAPLNGMDKNIVLGLFNYPESPKIPDATNEIDIEYSKLADLHNKRGNFTVWPSTLMKGYTNKTYAFKISLKNSYSTQRFSWSSTHVFFQSLKGWRIDNKHLISRKTFASKRFGKMIPQTPEPVHINLWLFNGLPPSNHKPMEVIINKFEYN